ncbi:MAG: hypothetical protein HYV35_03455, partial [Lentisphaerae bacterium]|nr:hypothetical protein [Lentisphaerota bacterium]
TAFPGVALADDLVADAPAINIADFQIAGDGKTPTFMQYLDAKGYDMKPALHLVTATSKGDVVYSYALELPPAILKPSLSLSYSSERGANIEMPYGWEISGIAEIRRPLVRAYDAYKWIEDFFDNEWLVTAPGFSGTLKPSGDEDFRFFLTAADPAYVVAEYDKNSNTWSVYHDALTWTMEEKDDGAGTKDGTAWWRVTRQQDTSGNYMTYAYFDDGRIKAVCYGSIGNLKPHFCGSGWRLGWTINR